MQAVLEPYGDGFTGDAVFVDLEGGIHRNKPEIEVRKAEPVPGTSRLKWPDGEEFETSTPAGYEIGPPAPATDEVELSDPPPLYASTDLPEPTEPASQQAAGPPAYAGTGPYRRVFLAPNSIQSIDVRGGLSPNAGMHPANVGGIGYAYLSPWSVQQNYASGGDYGLQFSHLRRVWDPFCVLGGRHFSSPRAIPPSASFTMTMQRPRSFPAHGRTYWVVDYFVEARYGSLYWSCTWIGELNSARAWGPANFGTAKVFSIAQIPEGNTGSFHNGAAWTQSKVVSGGQLRDWSGHPGGYALQRYPTTVNRPTWTRMPVVSAGSSPNAEGVSISCRP